MKVIIGIGVPGCGKTTILKPLAQTEGLLYLNADDIREPLTGSPTNHSKERLVWKIMNEKISQALKRSGVVIDVTHSKKTDRVKMVEFCRENGATEIIGFWVNTPLELCVQRNRDRNRNVPSHAIKTMWERLLKNPLRKLTALMKLLKSIDS